MLTGTQHRSAIEARGLRPIGELARNRPQGDRLRYMAGCRCPACRGANTAYERMRAKARKAGEANPFVPADAARAHIQALAAAGVGRRTLSIATDITEATLWAIKRGERANLRRATEKKILAMRADLLADGALVDAAPTWALIDALLKAGFTKKAIARGLGQQGSGLQLSRTRVTVRNAEKVRRLHDKLMATAERLVDATPSAALLQELLDEGYLPQRLQREIDGLPESMTLPKKIRAGLADQIAEAHRRLTQ
ncbi:hypothetical protein CGK74_13860 [Thauera propionica]|uniref:Uncharacterized protein n=1 Tax=Thauera propionica TaxID=2019431 RepID=A0A235EWB2_9RHOO|nr:hypothetical protein [Thauera propionica]OYD53294.1 hypothetical protein CGK74_13860 [Thauera propionica]